MADFATESKVEDHTKAGLVAAGLGLLLLTCIACNGTQPAEDPVTDPPEVTSASDEVMAPTESWRCRNDLEVSCGDGTCGVQPADGFTPMDVSFDDAGAMSVCAYSGCWEGTGEVVSSDNFLVLIGHDLAFSTASDPDSAGTNVVIALDRTDNVASLKAGTFANPLLCEQSEDAP